MKEKPKHPLIVFIEHLPVMVVGIAIIVFMILANTVWDNVI